MDFITHKWIKETENLPITSLLISECCSLSNNEKSALEAIKTTKNQIIVPNIMSASISGKTSFAEYADKLGGGVRDGVSVSPTFSPSCPPPNTHSLNIDRRNEKMAIDYNAEVEKASLSGADVFKPTTGSYNIRVLEEPEETQYVDESTKETTPQWRLVVDIAGETKTWYVSIGKTLSSVQKQLALIGKSRGKLKGETINLLVKHDGKKNEYTIVEAVELQKLEESKKK